MRIARSLPALACLLAFRLCAQTTGWVEGVVLDASGAAANQARVTVTAVATNASRVVDIAETGRYAVFGLPAGTYQIRVTASGFRTAVREGVVVSAGRATQANFDLQVGETSEAVTVAGSAPLVSTSAADWGGTVGQQQLTNLPLNGRDVFDLVAQQPGVYVANNNRGAVFSGLGIQASVNGNRPNQNSFRLDGLYVNDASGSAPASASGRLLGIEGIQEIRLITNPFSAEYGKAASSVFTAVSKSGSNTWNGVLYHFLRNSATDAKNFFDPANEATPPLRRNQFGGLLSGPVIANRVFFLVNYESVRESRGRTQRSITIGNDARLGILPTGRVTVNPAVQPFLDLFPAPNSVLFADGTGEFVTQAKLRNQEHYGVARVDFLPVERFRTSLRYSVSDAGSNQPDPYLIWDLRNGSHFGFLQSESHWIQSPTTLHSFRAGRSRVENTENGAPNVPSSVTFVRGRTLGTIEVTGITGLGPAAVAALPREHDFHNLQFNYDVTHTRGRHSLKAGAGFDHVYFRQVADFQASGRYRFNSLEEFLRGTPVGGDLMSPDSDTRRRWRYQQFHFFVQDEVRWRRNLSLILGVRYEGYTVPSEEDKKTGTLPNWLTDTRITTGGELFKNPSARNFAPRTAIAWDVFGKGTTVIRAGAGIFFDLLTSRELTIAGMRVPPFYRRLLLNAPAFPDLLAASAAATPDPAMDGLAYNLRQPYVLQFRFAVEQKLDSRTALEVAYARSRGIHLVGQYGDINVARAQVQSDGRLFYPLNSPLRNPAFGRIGLRATDFDSSSDALNVRLQRQLQAGFQMTASYTWSKAIDNSSTVAQADFDNSDRMPNPYDLGSQRGRSDFDVRHAFNANATWDGPALRGRWYAPVLGAWTVSSTVQVQTGFPFSPRVGFDRARHRSSFGDLDQRPVLAPGFDNIVTGRPTQYFDPNAFLLPDAGYYGNLGRNVLTGPGLFALNVGLQKTIFSRERHQVRLRVEGFNVTNEPNLDVPSELRLFTSNGRRVAAAGRISTTSTPARQFQFALRWAF